MKLDAVTVVPFPDSAAFGVMHEKFFETLVNSLNHAYSFADREDAVEEAFYKLMFKKDRDAYEKEPETEKDWFYALRWQARAALSHRRENAECHARYVEEAAKAPARSRMYPAATLTSTWELRQARLLAGSWPRATGLRRTMSMSSNTALDVSSASTALVVSNAPSKMRATSHSPSPHDIAGGCAERNFSTPAIFSARSRPGGGMRAML